MPLLISLQIQPELPSFIPHFSRAQTMVEITSSLQPHLQAKLLQIAEDSQHLALALCLYDEEEAALPLSVQLF